MTETEPFTAFPNGLLEQLIGAKLSAPAAMTAFAIVRLTIGFHTPSRRIPLSSLIDITRRSRTAIKVAIHELENRRILRVCRRHGSESMYEINRDVESWLPFGGQQIPEEQEALESWRERIVRLGEEDLTS